MDLIEIFKSTHKKVKNFVLSLIYPTVIIYSYFIIIGVICLDENKFKNTYTLFVFIAYHTIMLYTIVLYLRLFPTEGVSTRDLFYADSRTDRPVYIKLNPFIQDRVEGANRNKKRICDICKVFKPPRAHHCSTCNKCYLKMDHHCYLVNTCIGFHNYKFFLLYLVCNIIFGILAISVLLYELIAKMQPPSRMIHYIICSALFAIIMGMCLVLLVYHIVLLLRNETTLENIALNEYIFGSSPARTDVFQEGPLSKPRAALRSIAHEDEFNRYILNPYNLGKVDNIRQVFGDDIEQWVLPTFTSVGDGIAWPKNTKEIDEEYEFA